MNAVPTADGVPRVIAQQVDFVHGRDRPSRNGSGAGGDALEVPRCLQRDIH